MSRFLSFDHLWQHIEHLQDAELSEIYAAARSDKCFLFILFFLLAVYVAGTAAYSFAMPLFNRFYHPTMPITIILGVVTLGVICLYLKIVYTVAQHFFVRAVIRESSARQSTDAA